MINNSININKVNNHLSPKERLNSDDQQLYSQVRTWAFIHTCLRCFGFNDFRGQVVVLFVDIG
jgi:hypothetical protein